MSTPDEEDRLALLTQENNDLKADQVIFKDHLQDLLDDFPHDSECASATEGQACNCWRSGVRILLGEPPE